MLLLSWKKGGMIHERGQRVAPIVPLENCRDAFSGNKWVHEQALSCIWFEEIYIPFAKVWDSLL